MVSYGTLSSSDSDTGEMVLARERAPVGISDMWREWEGVAVRVLLTWEGGIELLRVVLRRELDPATADIKDLAARGAPWRVYLLGLPAVVGDTSRALSGSSFIGIYAGPGTKTEPARPRERIPLLIPPLRARRREYHR